MRRTAALALVLLLLLAGCSDRWSDVSGVADITDQMLLERAGNYSASRWSERLEGSDSAWRYSAGWGELTGARRMLKLEAGAETTLQASYTVEDAGEGLIVAVLCADDTVVRLSPGGSTLSLPEGRSWLVAAAYHSQGAFQLDLALTSGSLRVDTE